MSAPKPTAADPARLAPEHGRHPSHPHGGGPAPARRGRLRRRTERAGAADDRPRPARRRLSPWAVATYLHGGTLPDGTVITPKYVGPRRLIEVAVTTLATDRALLLLGVPGTAKTWVSEHLAAAVSGDSTLLVQGTAAPRRKPSATAGTTPGSSPTAPAATRWCPVR
ncbi:hypothetical protein SGRIM128S_07328 [Streptomyces griseomycini]